MNSNKYYTLLGLKKDDNPNLDQIKKAYKRSALKWHPDRNINNKLETEEKFKEINQAYEILSDPKKKKQYDLYGENIPRQGFQFNNMSGFTDPFEMFNHVFDSDISRFPGTSFHTFPMSQPVQPTKIYKYYIDISLEDLFTGCQKKMKVSYNIMDALSRRNVPISKIYDIVIKPGWKSGTKITYNIDNNEIIFILRETPHKYFTRKDNNLHWTCNLTHTQIKKGVKLSIKTAKVKETIQFTTVNKVIRDGDSVSITGKGMPIKNTGNRGDFIINFSIK